MGAEQAGTPKSKGGGQAGEEKKRSLASRMMILSSTEQLSTQSACDCPWEAFGGAPLIPASIPPQ